MIRTFRGTHGNPHDGQRAGTHRGQNPGRTIQPMEVIMSDTFAARLRTWWPVFLGHVAALIVAWVLKLTGIELDNALVFEAVSFALSGAIWESGRWLEARPNRVLAAVGRWLVSAGRQIGAPTYGQDAKR